MKTAAESRIAGVTEQKRRRHYGHAAELVATCVACDKTDETRCWAAALQAEYRRFPALRDELERAARAPLSSSRLRLEVAARDHAHQAGGRRDQKVAKKEPLLAAEGSVVFLERVSPAIEQVDGDGPGRIYIVEPLGPIEDDPNLTNKKFPGNPTGASASRRPGRGTRRSRSRR
jgi:hypothetical protein